MANQYKTIRQEISELEIEQKYFDDFYKELKKDIQAPSMGAIPPKQYVAILNYLISKQVLGSDYNLQEIGLKVFDYRINLEGKLEKAISDFGPDDDSILEPHGGVLPCRDENRSHGGVLPCRI
jgi:hypothetical protein